MNRSLSILILSDDILSNKRINKLTFLHKIINDVINLENWW